ncbi:MAG: trimethylamine methyltransferase family protein [Hyphomicrobiales bacterium]|nr:trimethylamine methyltransferase family protein [Hyphomicrobiales bacterium]
MIQSNMFESAPSTPPKSNRRGKGRARRIAQRTEEKPVFFPSPPGQIGGAYKPLSPDALQAVLNTAMRILEEIGMGLAPKRLELQAIEKGAFLNERGRLCYPRAMIEDIIDGAAKHFVLHGRDPQYDIEVGGERVFFGTGGAAVKTLDLDSGLYRASSLRDLYDFTRLVDTLPNIAWFTRCCIATDVEDPLDLDINTVYALLKGTQKPIGTSITLAEHVPAIIDMFDQCLGAQGSFRRKPFCKAHISPVVSPLRYGEDAVEVALACIEHNFPINAIIAAQSGATAPATLAGMLAQTTAETLAALAMINVFAPGHPVIFSNWPFVIDLRSGAFCGGGGEISFLNAAAGQIGNHLELPTGVASSMSDAKAVDAQMGAEKALSALATGLAGANMVYESCGMTASLLGASFEAFLLDNDMIGHIQRVLRGAEINEETLAFEAIRETVFGAGHFLGAQHTFNAMERDYFYPHFADRLAPDSWQELGAKDIWSVANANAKEILATHRPNYISAKADENIRAAHTIALPPN